MLEQAEWVQNRDLEDVATSVRFQINMVVAVNFSGGDVARCKLVTVGHVSEETTASIFTL